jgi:hypothetical protein
MLSGIIAMLVLASCSTVQDCASSAAQDNLTSVNSPGDEYGACRLGNTLLFLSTRKLSEEQSTDVVRGASEVLFESQYRSDGTFSPADLCRQFPVNRVRGGSVAYASPGAASPFMIFPKAIGEAKSQNTDLYISTFIEGVWSTPLPLSGVNSAAWDSQPSLSADGTLLVFASDRNGSVGGIDLYYCVRDGSTWSTPQNLGKAVNSEHDEITPCIAMRGELYFASNRPVKGATRGFELMRAYQVEPTIWKSVEALAAPFNSTSDDISPCVVGDSLVYASKRKGGCGGYDLYASALCGPVLLRGQILASKTITNRSGVVSILDSTGKFAPVTVPATGVFETKLFPNRRYVLRYMNDCIDEPLQQEFIAPCDETNSVVLKCAFTLPELQNNFSFEEYNVPFFSTGYYIPNTSDEINALQLKLAYNLPGAIDSSRQRALGDSQEFSPLIDSALDQAAEFIIRALEFRRSGCNTSTQKIRVTIEGFADARPFSKGSRYNGATINDDEFELYVDSGLEMNNKLLALLRAYSTAKVIQRRLERSPIYKQYRSRLKWHLSDGGEDPTEAPDTLKRRVELSVRLGD